ncbi:GAF and ANTAR domain-containing protein [Streptomonospora sp. PA3]|uniref:ANTAR domain-containing protein n=1 Tax=Streptomonospora sp. PA3 TaxID=2607326 RepID=UPI0016426142
MVGTTAGPEGTGEENRPHAQADSVEGLTTAKAFAEVARDLQASETLPVTLEEITALAVAEIPGCAYAGVCLIESKKRLTTYASTASVVDKLDALQHSKGQGPCIEAVWVRESFAIEDVQQETRWPEFSAEAARLGIASMASFQLFTRNDVLGALNLYATEPEAFDAAAVELGEIFAAHAAVALAEAQTTHNLTRAVRSRQRIGEATGILMERYKITEQQAFALLSKASQNLNIKLVDLAEDLVHTGSLPDQTP